MTNFAGPSQRRTRGREGERAKERSRERVQISGDDCTEAKGKKRSKAKKEGKRERRRRREWRKMEAGLDGIAEEGNRAGNGWRSAGRGEAIALSRRSAIRWFERAWFETANVRLRAASFGGGREGGGEGWWEPQGAEGVTRARRRWQRQRQRGGRKGDDETRKRKEKKGRESARERRRVLEIRLLHRAAGWEKPKALVTFLYVNLGRCTFRPGTIWWGAQIGGMHLVGAARRIAHLGAAFEVKEGVSSNETGPRLAREF
ncbi:hypothetical protein DBV15_09280 [Temnothorax longispinosus]|uniref:Uncharacterized protein n=1 Tax=Temnothorax longispinosus TaxID=300112 RepID=A0A4S2KMD3_9HYME|nr:hypothetical protein DBV15_09280 [Temnothorax longispinosus]